MVRLVFRPYTQVMQSICTSELLQTSTRVSSGFVLPRHSSPSFGYQHVRSDSATSTGREVGGSVLRPGSGLPPTTQDRTIYFHYAPQAWSRLSDLRIC